MLKKLYVRNYLLIDELDIDFKKGFTVITGETGAGKSILLGALNLLLGKRAELKSLMREEEKCIIEGTFLLDKEFEQWFDAEELDFDDETTIRREISPKGKSRSFINDTPVSLQQLKSIAPLLFDIHAQHQTLQLKSQEFKLSLLDGLVGQSDLFRKYRSAYSKFSLLQKEKGILEERIVEQKQRMDYVQFQLDELDTLNLSEKEYSLLEKEQKRLLNAELLQQKLSQSIHYFDHDESGVLTQLYQIEQLIGDLSEMLPEGHEMLKRLRSAQLELNDISASLSDELEQSKVDPDRLVQVEERISEINRLMHKHALMDENELLELAERFRAELIDIEGNEDTLESITNDVAQAEAECMRLAQILSENRCSVLPEVENKVVNTLKTIGIPKAKFKIQHRFKATLGPYGKDEFLYLFSANAGREPELVEQIASGGELSRLMLALKSLMAEGKQLPTMIFDEIDSGISGEIAIEVGKLLKQLSHKFQLISISHLPQIAALSEHHYLVYKYEDKEVTQSNLKQLNKDERLVELAKMIGGKNYSETAVQSARELLAN